MMDLLSELISSFDPNRPHFRPTEIYNESWLIKLVLHHASTIQDTDHFLGFLPGSTWYSEGILPTAFRARTRGDPLSEARTNADGVIGHFRIGNKAKADLELIEDAKQFTVVEAKVGSHLSSGVAHAKYYDQAARTVACMAETIKRARLEPSKLDRLDFIVLAPQASIEKGIFSIEMDPDSIRSKVQKRTSAYDGQLENWYRKHFEPTLERIRLHSLSWESALEWVSDKKPMIANDLSQYYQRCLQYK
jgi:hypothetical protein